MYTTYSSKPIKVNERFVTCLPAHFTGLTKRVALASPGVNICNNSSIMIRIDNLLVDLNKIVLIEEEVYENPLYVPSIKGVVEEQGEMTIKASIIHFNNGHSTKLLNKSIDQRPSII